MYITSGDFATPAESANATLHPQAGGLVGIVVDLDRDVAALEAYLDVPVGPFVLIRRLADVPRSLGGIAILSHELVTGELAESLSRALGVTE